jgi:flagellar hook protein FlgE
MLRSLYSGISGMKGSQTNLDVVGSNIANVNTTGYKKGRITFQDMMSQQLSATKAPGDNSGGVNASQVGTGSQIGSVDNIHTQGNRQTTNRSLDLALEGDGMFVLSNTSDGSAELNADGVGEEVSFTRAGNFYIDGNNYLVNKDGLFVLDAAGSAIELPADATNISINDAGQIEVTTEEEYTTKQIGLAKFSNPGGLTKNGGSTYSFSGNAGLVAGFQTPGEGGAASIVSGALEMSNVDLADEFTNMIIAQRSFQANTKIITTSDQILEELVNLKR